MLPDGCKHRFPSRCVQHDWSTDHQSALIALPPGMVRDESRAVKVVIAIYRLCRVTMQSVTVAGEREEVGEQQRGKCQTSARILGMLSRLG